MEILRFITAGNVDDGKSTLIGRLLYDTNNIKNDILQSIGEKSDKLNLAHVTDGLRAERKQGITIDVAYKYFTTSKKKFILIDAPGHTQYTKNLVTGASAADVMIILIDAQIGVTEQTRRHSLVADFLKIEHIIVAVNKMDAVNSIESTFLSIREEYQKIAKLLHLKGVDYIPISALTGENVSSLTEKMKWYQNDNLLLLLENYKPINANLKSLRFSVQCGILDNKSNSTGYAGKVISGELSKNNQVLISPSGDNATISKIIRDFNEVNHASAGQNITVFLEGNKKLKRGNILSEFINNPICKNKIFATIFWLDDSKQLTEGVEYFLKINSSETTCRVTEILYTIDNRTFEKRAGKTVELNQFAKIEITTLYYIVFDPFSKLRETGRGIIIDKESFYTSGAFVIEG